MSEHISWEEIPKYETSQELTPLAEKRDGEYVKVEAENVSETEDAEYSKVKTDSVSEVENVKVIEAEVVQQPYEAKDISLSDFNNRNGQALVEIISGDEHHYLKLPHQDSSFAYYGPGNKDVDLLNFFGPNDSIVNVGQEASFVDAETNENIVIPKIDQIIVYPDGKDIND